MRSPEPHDLLADVLAEATPPEFQAEVLAETIRWAKQRRRTRRINQSVAAVTLCLLVALLGGRLFRPTATRSRPIAPAYTLVRTQPLPPTLVVHTDPAQHARVIASASDVVVVHTHGGGFRPIGDRELLAVLAPRPVLLVKDGPGRETLVFADTP